MWGARRRRRAESEGGGGDRSPAETLVELAGRPLSGPPHDPFRLGGGDDDHLIGGYRVLRLIGRGSRADVYLGRLPTWAVTPATAPAVRAGIPPPFPEEPDTFGLPAEVALKVFRPGTDAASIDRELTALSAVTSPHVVRLHDVARVADGPVCFLLGRCDGGSLSALLGDRRGIPPGEAVTVLVPILEGLASMHRTGFTHGALRLSSVLFDAAGTPVLAGWGHGVVLLDDRGRLPGPERLAATPAVVADLRRFAAVAEAVLDRVEGGARLSSALRGMTERGSADTEARLSDALFDFAEPLPVALAPPDGATLPPSNAPSGGGYPSATTHGSPMRVPVEEGRSEEGRVEEGWGRPSSAGHRSTTARGSTRRAPHVIASIRAGARTVRRRVWVAAGLAVAAAVLAAALLLEEGAPTAMSSGAREPASTETAPSLPAPAESPATEAIPRRAPGEADAASLQTAITGDDPVAAAVALLRLRAECIRMRSTACLDGVDQPGSVAVAADLAAVERADRSRADARDEVAGQGRPALGASEAPGTSGADPPVLVDRLGGTAIVAVPVALLGDAGPETPPASLLMIRSEAGWRIRDVL